MIACFGRSKGESQHCPDQLAARYPDRRPDFREDDLTWDLTNDVADSPSGVDQVDLISVHRQILLHTTHERIADIGLVKILDEVS